MEGVAYSVIYPPPEAGRLRTSPLRGETTG